MAQAPTLPQAPALQSNIHISTHPCVRAKLSQIRSKDANARETQSLVHEIALLVACDALASGLQTVSTGTVSLSYSLAYPSLCSELPIPLPLHPTFNWGPYCLLFGDYHRTDITQIQDETPLGYEYTTETAYPKIALVPILRSGLGMVDGMSFRSHAIFQPPCPLLTLLP